MPSKAKKCCRHKEQGKIPSQRKTCLREVLVAIGLGFVLSFAGVNNGIADPVATIAYIDMIYIIISPYANSSSFEVKIALRMTALIISSGDTYSFWEIFW